MKILYLAFILTSMMFLQSCSSYNVKPVSEDLIWKDGKGFVQSKNESLTLQVAVDYATGNNQRFLVEIENNSPNDLLINPQEFFITDKLGQGLVASNPENEIAELSRQIENKKEVLDTRLFDLTDSMLGLTLTIADRKDANLEERVAKREKEQVEAKDDVLYLENQKVELETAYIRKTTLPSKSKIKGFLKFKNELVAGTLNIVLKNSGNDIVVPFQVIKN